MKWMAIGQELKLLPWVPKHTQPHVRSAAEWCRHLFQKVEIKKCIYFFIILKRGLKISKVDLFLEREDKLFITIKLHDGDTLRNVHKAR